METTTPAQLTMDPRTALFTFMLETAPSVQSVKLLGSWDNFATPYKMERDARRDRGQWKCCHSFQNLMYDNKGSRRDNGLKMGQPYYYYYELDGCIETHDPLLPSTTACPYLPGQSVNLMSLPVEQTLRKRSASLTSLRHENYMTVNPDDKFVAPRPAPSPPVAAMTPFRLPTAAAVPQSNSMVQHILRHKRSARSLSPGPNWLWSPRKLFSRKNSSSALKEIGDQNFGERTASPYSDVRPRTSSREMSPESLRRWLSDDSPTFRGTSSGRTTPHMSPLSIPDEIEEEPEDEVDDDDNFATSFTTSPASECAAPTRLSPPPFQRQHSPNTILQPAPPKSPTIFEAPTQDASSVPPQVPTIHRTKPSMTLDLSSLTPLHTLLDQNPPSQSRFSFSSDGSRIPEAPSLASPLSSTYNDPPSFYHSEDEDLEDDDGESVNFLPLQGIPSSQASTLGSKRNKNGRKARRRKPVEDTMFLSSSPISTSFAGYSLPRSSFDGSDARKFVGGSPKAIVNSPSALPAVPTGLLADDFVGELRWMAGAIHH